MALPPVVSYRLNRLLIDDDPAREKGSAPGPPLGLGSAVMETEERAARLDSRQLSIRFGRLTSHHVHVTRATPGAATTPRRPTVA